MKKYYLEQLYYYQNRLNKINDKLKEINDFELKKLLMSEKIKCEADIDFYEKQLALIELLGD